MTAFVADLDELSAVVRSLAACERRLATLADDLARAQSVGQEHWDGAAADAEATAYAGWHAGCAAMREALDRMRAAADRARTQYSATADLNRALWQQVG